MKKILAITFLLAALAVPIKTSAFIVEIVPAYEEVTLSSNFNIA